jgi:hypothetical protein
MSRAFITGSRKYGFPKEDSDIDLVVFIQSEKEYELLGNLSDASGAITCLEEYEGTVLPSLRFGNLNLICCINEAEYNCWRDGTNEMAAMKPITRDAAIEHLAKLRIERGLRK